MKRSSCSGGPIQVYWQQLVVWVVFVTFDLGNNTMKSITCRAVLLLDNIIHYIWFLLNIFNIIFSIHIYISTLCVFILYHSSIHRFFSIIHSSFLRWLKAFATLFGQQQPTERLPETAEQPHWMFCPWNSGMFICSFAAVSFSTLCFSSDVQRHIYVYA